MSYTGSGEHIQEQKNDCYGKTFYDDSLREKKPLNMSNEVKMQSTSQQQIPNNNFCFSQPPFYLLVPVNNLNNMSLPNNNNPIMPQSFPYYCRQQSEYLIYPPHNGTNNTPNNPSLDGFQQMDNFSQFNNQNMQIPMPMHMPMPNIQNIQNFQNIQNNIEFQIPQNKNYFQNMVPNNQIFQFPNFGTPYKNNEIGDISYSNFFN